MRNITNQDIELTKDCLSAANITWTYFQIDEENKDILRFSVKDGYISFRFATESWKKNASEQMHIFFETTMRDMRYKKKVYDIWGDGVNHKSPNVIKFKNSLHNNTRIVNALKDAYHNQFVPFINALIKVNKNYQNSLNVKDDFFNKVKDLEMMTHTDRFPNANIGDEYRLIFKGGSLKNFYDTKCEMTVELPYDQMEKVLNFINEMKKS